MDTTLKQLKAKTLQNSAVKAEYDFMALEYKAIKDSMAKRQN